MERIPQSIKNSMGPYQRTPKPLSKLLELLDPRDFWSFNDMDVIENRGFSPQIIAICS